MTTPYDPLLRTKEAADILGVCQRTLTTWADEGRLPFSRTEGGHRRLRHSDVLALQARLAFPLGTSEPDMLAAVTRQRDALKQALKQALKHILAIEEADAYDEVRKIRMLASTTLAQL